MRIVSFTEAWNGLKSVLNDADCTVIIRRDAEDAVIMSMDYYNSLIETIHLTRSPANAANLNNSIAQYNVGQTTEKDLLEWIERKPNRFLVTQNRRYKQIGLWG